MSTAGDIETEHSDQLGSEDLNEISCEPCQTKGILEKAVGLCMDCQEYLCERCYTAHTIPTALQNHELIDKEQIEQSRVSLQRKDQCREKCVVHEDEVIKYYCVIHDHLGCSACITLDHRLCDNVTYIPHASKDLANNEEFKQAEDQLKAIFKKSNHVHHTTKQHTQSLVEDSSNVIKMVQDFRQEINKTLDRLESDIIEKAKLAKTEETKKVKDITEKFNTAHSELQATMKHLHRLQNNQQYCNLYTIMMKTKNRLNTLSNEVLKAGRDQLLVDDKIIFEPNRDIIDTLMNSRAFGMVVRSRTEDMVSEKESKTIKRFKHKKDINAKFPEDEYKCWITGSTSLHDGRLIMTDCLNKSLKLIDVSEGKPLTRLVMSSSPWDVTLIANNQAAVTLPHEKTIAIITVAFFSMSLDRTIPVSGSCHGLSYVDEKLAVTLYDKNEVQVLDMQGSVLHSIATGSTGLSIFNKPYYVTFGKDKNSLYVSNSGMYDDVVCVKFDGLVVAKYMELKGPRGLVVDKNGNVFICSTYANHIQQIAPDFKTIKMSLAEADRLVKPYSISYSESDHSFHVGMWESMQCNCIKMYEAIFGSD